MDNVNIKGNYEINDSKKYGDIVIKGDFIVNADIQVENLNAKGETTSNSDINCSGFCNLKGKIKLNTINANTIKIKGKIIANKIEASDVDIVSSRNSNIKEVSGKSILIKNGTNDSENEEFMNSILKLFKVNTEYNAPKTKTIFEVDKIVGDNIELIGISSKEVTGKNVIIGEGCNIDKVYYSETVRIDENSIVNMQNKVG